MSDDQVLYEVADGVGWITLNRPDSLNAIDLSVAIALRRALDRAHGDKRLRALVLTGTGRAFCAGGDIAAFRANLDEAPSFLREIILHLHGAISLLLDLRVPAIAGVNGMTAGAGMGLAMAPDLAIAAESAVFTMAYTGIGATPDGSTTYFLPRIVGTRRAMEMIHTNRRLGAAEALEWGLVNKVVSDGAFRDELTALAAQLAAGPTRAYGGARRLIRESLSTPLAEQLEGEAASIAAMGATDDFREGVSAFIDKRKPDFRGA